MWYLQQLKEGTLLKGRELMEWVKNSSFGWLGVPADEVFFPQIAAFS